MRFDKPLRLQLKGERQPSLSNFKRAASFG
jgi:hypothetical protein